MAKDCLIVCVLRYLQLFINLNTWAVIDNNFENVFNLEVSKKLWCGKYSGSLPYHFKP